MAASEVSGSATVNQTNSTGAPRNQPTPNVIASEAVNITFKHYRGPVNAEDRHLQSGVEALEGSSDNKAVEKRAAEARVEEGGAGEESVQPIPQEGDVDTRESKVSDGEDEDAVSLVLYVNSDVSELRRFGPLLGNRPGDIFQSR